MTADDIDRREAETSRALAARLSQERATLKPSRGAGLAEDHPDLFSFGFNRRIGEFLRTEANVAGPRRAARLCEISGRLEAGGNPISAESVTLRSRIFEEGLLHRDMIRLVCLDDCLAAERLFLRERQMARGREDALLAKAGAKEGHIDVAALRDILAEGLHERLSDIRPFQDRGLSRDDRIWVGAARKILERPADGRTVSDLWDRAGEVLGASSQEARIGAVAARGAISKAGPEFLAVSVHPARPRNAGRREAPGTACL